MKVNKPIKQDWNQYENYLLDCIAEPKLDGIRCLLTKEDNQVKLVREDGTIKTKQYPEIIKATENIPDGTIIDGEICILKNEYFANFFELLQRNTVVDDLKIRLLAKKMPATFMAFDVLKYEDQDTTKEILSSRKEILGRIPVNERVNQVSVFEPKDLVEKVTQFDMEGIVTKNLNSVYNSEWQKFKHWYESDFKVIGFTSEVNLISALELEDMKGNYVGKVNYTGYPQTEEWAKKVVGMTAVVRYMKTNTLKLRHPVLVELREK